MSKKTNNYNLNIATLADTANIENVVGSNLATIDNGLTLDVGYSNMASINVYTLYCTEVEKLNSNNRGVKLIFWADKNSTGNSNIKIKIGDSGTEYVLLNRNKSEFKNIKKGVPYTIIWDGNLNFFLASGADDSDSTSVGTDGSNVKTGITFIGTDGEVHTGIYTADGTMVAADLLSGKIGHSKGNKIVGAMANNGAKTASLNCGGSYVIPEGYHNGSGKVTANSLASQTSATATVADIISGKTAWVNGNLITGTASITSLGGSLFKTGTNTVASSSDESWASISVNCGFKPTVVIVTTSSDALMCSSIKGSSIWYRIGGSGVSFSNFGGITSIGFDGKIYNNYSNNEITYTYYAWS